MFDYFKSKERLHKEKKMLIEENLKLQEHINAKRKYEKFLVEEMFRYKDENLNLKKKLEAITDQSKIASKNIV